MKWIKDLLYNRGNQSLDIARAFSASSITVYWVGIFTGRVTGDALAVGGGCAALFGGAAAWIHFRQKHEEGKPEGE